MLSVVSVGDLGGSAVAAVVFAMLLAEVVDFADYHVKKPLLKDLAPTYLHKVLLPL